ncbi:hypothetical protein P171DRAFT_487355 [Karstenula rhodostoma CBS 690.94]|uniref:MIT domain-containing protein n=1 Tax=Karstenula rhodostoma CBS 690.94 TaxID=1392251 RepID=A0A9P4PFA3_9PLEO|nr:hypothetical protein P171DRAFT_487355 [Karstenula rhodostoma CBS 690.94]
MSGASSHNRLVFKMLVAVLRLSPKPHFPVSPQPADWPAKRHHIAFGDETQDGAFICSPSLVWWCCTILSTCIHSAILHAFTTEEAPIQDQTVQMMQRISVRKPPHTNSEEDSVSKDRITLQSNDTDSNSSSNASANQDPQPFRPKQLSRALQKVKTAALHDNAQSLAAAQECYAEACNLLQSVVVRCSQESDQQKLSAIIQIYEYRIEELKRI